MNCLCYRASIDKFQNRGVQGSVLMTPIIILQPSTQVKITLRCVTNLKINLQIFNIQGLVNVMFHILIVLDGKLYSGTSVLKYRKDPLIYSEPLRTVQHDSLWLNGNISPFSK